MSGVESPQLSVLLEDTWEAEDIIEECAKRGVPCQELTPEQLQVTDVQEFVLHSIFMCNTEIVQAKLREFHAALHAKVVPDTYPCELHELLHRSISRRPLGSIDTVELPLFVKPASNDKAFDGRVIADSLQLAGVKTEASGYLKSTDGASGDVASLEVYAAVPVHFRAEFRLFIGGGQVYQGSSEKEAYRIRDDTDSTSEDLVPPQRFVQEVVRACPPDAFWAVDVGMMVAPAAIEAAGADAIDVADGKWAVVEVNPSFALDDHGLPIEPYLDYCSDACAWIRSTALQI